MSYIKQTWVDRAVEFFRRFSVTEDSAGNLTLTEEPGIVTSAGTPLDATRLNHIENGIEEVSNNLNLVWSHVYPVGCLFETTDSAFNPQTHFGGTWEQYGAGRVTVGYSSGETEFNSGGKTGGAKTHTLTEAQIPSHQHDTINPPQYGSAYPTFGPALSANENNHQKILGGAGGGGSATNAGIIKTGFKGSGQAHNNLQPYITVFRWRRTA